MTIPEQLITESRRLSPTTRRAYTFALGDFLTYAGRQAPSWTPAKVNAWVQVVRDRASPQTANRYLAALRWVGKRYEAMEHGRDFTRGVESFPTGAQIRPHRALSHDEVRRVLATCEAPKRGAGAAGIRVTLRDYTLLRLGFDLGLRRAELARLAWGDWDRAARTLRIVGKGLPGSAAPKVVALDLGDELTAILQRLYDALPEYLRVPLAPVLPCVPPAVTGVPGGLGYDGVVNVIHRRGAEAGVTFTAHDMRHTMITHGLAAGVPPWRVQKAARHENLAMTLGTYAHDPAEHGDAVSVAQLVANHRRLPEPPTKGK